MSLRGSLNDRSNPHHKGRDCFASDSHDSVLETFKSPVEIAGCIDQKLVLWYNPRSPLVGRLFKFGHSKRMRLQRVHGSIPAR